MINVVGDFLDAMRQKGDSEADGIVAAVVLNQEQASLYSYFRMPEAEIRYNDQNSRVQEFLLKNRSIPAWYDAEKIQRGQLFFRKYALDIMTLLGSLSLPYCYAATPGNKAIFLTEKMRKAPGKRLLDTAQFIIGVMEPGCFNDEATGHIHINKTRLIHALVRYHIQEKTKWENQWGVPVNQEDMAGTNLAFSYIILVGLERTKFPITPEEKEDFLFVWRYIGYQLHIDNQLLPESLQQASLLETAIRLRHFKKSEEGKLLTKELIKHYKISFPLIASYFVDGQIRYFVGSEIAELLGLEEEPVKDFFIRKINMLKEFANKSYVNKKSYEIMYKNHLILHKRYS